jgi:Protein of unknown function (DUF2815)
MAAQSGNRGVSFGLNNVQLLRDDESLGGNRRSADTEFEPVALSGTASDAFSDVA